MFASLYGNRSLIVQLAARDVAQRYKNSMLGVLWVLAQPLLQLALYSFVFQVVLRARWGAVPGTSGETPFGLMLFVGLLLHATLAESLTRAPALIASHQSFVKRVIFPLDVLPVVTTLSAAVSLMLGFGILLVSTLAIVQQLPLQALLVPIPVLSLLVFSTGVAWILAALGVYFRDLTQLTPHVATLLLFTSPICYPADMVPVQFRWLLKINPLTVPVESARAMLFGGPVDALALAVFAAVAVVTAWVGLRLFNSMRVGFADVL